MISREHKTIFVHIQKTAGTSMEKKLGLFDKPYRGVQDHRKIRDYEQLPYRRKSLRRCWNNFKRGNFSRSYKYANNFVFPELTEDEYQEFYKFTFIRNSWARIYSWYAACIRDEIIRGNLGISGECSLNFFIRNKMKHRYFNQMSFITDSKGNIPMDFIGRFDNLYQDFAKVCGEIGLQDSELPELGVSGNKHYSHYYDNETKDLVYKLYKEEIHYFKFEFSEG